MYNYISGAHASFCALKKGCDENRKKETKKDLKK